MSSASLLEVLPTGVVVEAVKFPKRYLDTLRYGDRWTHITLLNGDEKRLLAMRRIAAWRDVVFLHGHRNGNLSVFLHRNHRCATYLANVGEIWPYGKIIIRRAKPNVSY